MRYVLLSWFVVLSVACGDGSTSPVERPSAADAAPVADAEEMPDAGIFDLRPYELRVPAGYDGSEPTPLVIVLHGITLTALAQDAFYKLSPLVDERGFLYALPDGIENRDGDQFWNATDACCDFYGEGADDVGYVAALIDDVAARYNLDERRVYVIGYSNGAYLAHRLACDLSDRIAAIAPLAGHNWNDPANCQPSEPVAVLQMFGDADELYAGGTTTAGVAVPSAQTDAERWAAANGCAGPVADTGETLDLEALAPDAETAIQRASDCPAGGAVEMWTLHGVAHVAVFHDDAAGHIYDFLAAQAKPAP